MTTSEAAVVLRDVCKTYRLYQRPHHRLLDVLGLLRDESLVSEHRALDGVSFDVPRGQKVGIIGRNGAGKSTLLKLITNVITPSSGRIEVRGETQALLQIGTGFHPDLTGRENVLSYLAHLGIDGAEARERVDEVIDFAELEEYAEQPVKTYSTGMGMRLMFAASTVIDPEILVIDEVLGVGDAYFAKKSFERIDQLCTQSNTTLLLVTHDTYSAARLCDRILWIEHGRVRFDAEPTLAVKAYENSIREQEEARQRQRLAARFPAGVPDRSRPLVVELRSPANRPPPAAIWLSRVAIEREGRELDALPLTEAVEAAGGEASRLASDGAWGSPAEHSGRMARPMLNYGSTSHKVGGALLLTEAELRELDACALVIDHCCETDVELDVVAIPPEGREVPLGRLQAGSGEWRRFDAPVREDAAESASARARAELVEAADRHGSGRVTVSAFRVLDAAGKEAFEFGWGAPLRLEFDFSVNDPRLRERCQVMFVFHRNGTEDACRAMTRDLLFDGSAASSGTVRLDVSRLPIGAGRYTVTLIVTKPGYYDERVTVFYSINPDVYACHSRIVEIEVRGEECEATYGTAVLLDGPLQLEWTLRAAEAS